MKNIRHQITPRFQVALTEPEDILALAQDCSKQGEYTLSALLLYRATDRAVSDFVNTRYPFSNWSAAPYAEIRDHFLELKSNLFTTSALFLPKYLGVSDRLIIVHMLSPNILKMKDLKHCLRATDIRHHSWLAHGNVSVKASDYQFMVSHLRLLIQRIKC